jgi:hypothetical protein
MPASAVPAKALRQWGHFLLGGGGATLSGEADREEADWGEAGVFRSPGGRGRRDLL